MRPIFLLSALAACGGDPGVDAPVNCADETRAEPFVAFAEQRIRGAILDELRRGDIMPRRLRQKARQIGQVIQQLEAELVAVEKYYRDT